MLTIIHGDDDVGKQKKLDQVKSLLSQQQLELVELDGKKIEPQDLTLAFSDQNLFASHKSLLILNLLSSIASSRRTQLIKLLTAREANLPDIVLFESKVLGKRDLTKLKPDQVFELTLPKLLFTFLDSFSPSSKAKALKLFNELIATQPVELVMSMIVRQIRLMIQAQDHALAKAPPWMQTKLSRQAGSFGAYELLAIHSQLLQIDYGIKSGNSILDLKAQLDSLIAGL